MFKPNIYLPLNISRTKPNNNLITSSFKNDAINLVDWLGIDLADGNSSLVLSQAGTWVSNGSPSAPVNSIQYNNAGAFGGDALFTRDPVTLTTLIATPLVGLGDITSLGNSTTFAVTDADQSIDANTNGSFNVSNVGGVDVFFQVGIDEGIYQLGDFGSTLNGTYFKIDDTTQTIEVTNVPAYANNAAAFAAIGANKLYYTDVAGEYILKLSH